MRIVWAYVGACSPAVMLRATITRVHVSRAVLLAYNHTNAHPSPPAVNTSTSAKLFADAANEEEPPFQSQSQSQCRVLSQQQQQEHKNWDGEEAIEDVVLRMLVDKYKPLRAGPVVNAEEKMRRGGVLPAPIPTPTPTPTPPTVNPPPAPPAGEHRPWLTTFRVPSHAAASIHYMNLPPKPSLSTVSGSSRVSLTPTTLDTSDDSSRTRNLARAQTRKALQAGRLTSAFDASLDYKLGKPSRTTSNISSSSASSHSSLNPNPVTLKGWAGLVEERIERARREGKFQKLRGRGKPIGAVDAGARVEDYAAYGNPFIAREEFLMNRIVRRQGAAPPWVEYQNELDKAVATFRTGLRESLTRQTLRHILSSHPLPILASYLSASASASASATLSQVSSSSSSPTSTPFPLPLRPSPTWLSTHQPYHTQAINELNALVRRYNGVAPYAVRRPYLSLEGEVEGVLCEEAWRGEVVRGLGERVRERRGAGAPGVWDGEDEDEEWVMREEDRKGGQDAKEGGRGSGWAIWRLWERVVARFVQ